MKRKEQKSEEEVGAERGKEGLGFRSYPNYARSYLPLY